MSLPILNIAAYEIVALNNESYFPLEGQVTDLAPIPKPDTSKSINYQEAALVAHMELSIRLIFLEVKMEVLRDSLYGIWKSKNEAAFDV